MGIDKVSACVEETQNELNQLEMKKSNFLADVAEAENKISLQTETFVSLIQSQQRHLVNELNLFKVKKLKEIDAGRKKLERLLARRESFKTQVQEMVDKGSACDLSRTANEVEARLKKVITTSKVDNDWSRVDIAVTSDSVFKRSLATSCQAMKAVGVLSFKGMFFKY